jgi:hypothetical protein
MSTYLTYAPVLEHLAAENSLSIAEVPEARGAVRPARTRLFAAAVLRRLAQLELAAAARLERRPSGRHLATA